MTPAGNHAWRQIGAYGTDNRRFARTLVISLVVHGILAWLLLYHLDQFSPVHPPKAYLVELMSPVGSEPEPQPALTEKVIIPPPSAAPVPPPPQPEPVKPLPQTVQIEPPPPPQQVPLTPPPSPPVVTTKVQPDLPPPKSPNRAVPRTQSTVPQLNEATPSPSPAQRDVEMPMPTVSTKQQARRPENLATLPPEQALPSSRRNQDVVDTRRTTPNYQPARQPAQETLPEQSGGHVPATATRGDVAIPDRPSRRSEPRSPRNDAPLPVDSGQQLRTRTSDTTVASPRGPASVPGKVSAATKNESLPVSSTNFAPVPSGSTTVPLPGATGPAITGRTGQASTGGAMPRSKTPILQTSAQATVDQASLAAFRSLKTCLDTELEKKLKIRLAVLVEGDATCSTEEGTRFFFAATETEQTLQVGIAPGAGQNFKDRCDALQQAVRCVEQSRK